MKLVSSGGRKKYYKCGENMYPRKKIKLLEKRG